MRKTNINDQLKSEIQQRRQDDKALLERLSFEQLLSDISARLIADPFNQVDAEIENALRQMMEFLSVDRCGLIEVSPDRTVVKISHVTYAEGFPPLPQDINLVKLYPWLIERLVVQGLPFSLEKLDDLPPEAHEDKKELASRGVVSSLYIPLSSGGRIVSIMVINALRAPRVWPEEYIPRLRLLGNIIVNALERKQVKMDLDERLEFERMITEISAHFINLPVDLIDDAIEDAQRRVCECLDLDIAVFWQWSMESPGILNLTHVYRPLGGPPIPEPMNAHEYFPWSQEQLEAGRTIILSSMDDFPPEAARDQEVSRYFGLKSTLNIPMSIGGGPIIGVLSFNTTVKERTWPEELVARLRLVAQIFINAIVRKKNEMALRESESRLSMTTEAVGAGLWIMDIETKKVWVSSKSRELFHFEPDEEITYDSYFGKIHPDDRDRVHQEVQHALKSGEILFCDYRIVLPDGSIRWIVARGQCFWKTAVEPERFIGLSLDITERKKMEEQLSESQTLLTSLINSTSDLIWSVDPQRFGLLTFNRGLYEYFLHDIGLHIETGMNPDELLPPDFARQWHALYRRALAEGTFTTEYSAYAGGRTLRLNLNTLQRDGEVFGISVFGQEITERKHLEEQLKQSLEEVKQLKDRLQMENVYLREEVKFIYSHTEIVGNSKPIKDVMANADKVGPTDSTVLLLGETGTGKELFAHAIHNMSARKDRTLVMVNCASLPPTLIESELFGREKGAYTGSLSKMVGRFELADGSTLFLDEIGDLPLELQSKLLRILEHGEFERLGSSNTIKVNVRLIAATNHDLASDVKDGRFRKDLYYRLNVFPIIIPPLRERKDDIPALVWSFVKQFEKSLGKPIESIPKKNMEDLMQYSWPGNIRELRNVIEHAMILSTGKTLNVKPPVYAPMEKSGSFSLQDMERSHIIEVLESTNWRLSGKDSASEILGMKRTTLQSKMKALGIKRKVS